VYNISATTYQVDTDQIGILKTYREFIIACAGNYGKLEHWQHPLTLVTVYWIICKVYVKYLCYV